MSNLLAKIQIHPGKEAEFEDVMAFMYKQTHGTEEGVLRYEYWRGQETGFYYCLLSFTDNLAFWLHQASDHHEGEMQRFAECIASLDLEVIDPVQGASPLPATHASELPADAPQAVRVQAETFPISEANWWQPLRVPLGHLANDELEAGLEEIRQAPLDGGPLEMIVSRPRMGEREVLVEGELDVEAGLLGDSWLARQKMSGTDVALRDTQLNIMNSRVTQLLAGSRERWALAGDQLYVDMNLSDENLPPGTQLSLGDAVIEVTAEPHLGCAKFVERYGKEAMKFVNSTVGKQLNLRGINARVVRGGRFELGATLRKVDKAE